MRKITSQEIQNVSGGLTGAQIGATSGAQIGHIVDSAYNSFTGGNVTSQAEAGAMLGAGIGSIVDAAFSKSPEALVSNINNAIEGIGKGTIGIVSGWANGFRSIFHR